MRSTGFLPEIADRDPRQLWIERGALDSQAHAMQRVRDILTRDNPAGFSPEVDARIRAEFKDMVAGTLEPPTGWTRPAGAPTARRSREERRRRRETAGSEA
jgi:trimethylamine:corrinoid methyltransferase-like protein